MEVDPEQARDAGAFLDLLRRLRVSAGNPSLAMLSRRTGIPRSTLHDALNPRRSHLPPWDLTRRLVEACDWPAEQMGRWATAWRRIATPANHLTGTLPRQLPARPHPFVGRERELAALDAALLPEPAGAGVAQVSVAVLAGVGGIGKTWLALRWAHERLSSFPDGQLFLDLRGFDPAGPPTPPEVALRCLLEALAVPGAAIPAQREAQVGLYRSLVAGKRMLIVLDNARDTAQIGSLLPGDPMTTVLVTSRHRMAGMITAHGARVLDVALFDPREARLVLGAESVQAEPEPAAAIIRLCAGLPLALRIAAARAAGHAACRTHGDASGGLAAVRAELAEARLDALDGGDLGADVRAVFASSYRALPRPAARMFRLLGLAEAAEIELSAAAALAGVDAPAARSLLRDLHRAHLLDEPSPGWYQLHDLVRLYAAEAGSVERDPAPVRRLADFYAHAAVAAAAVLEPDRPQIPLLAPVPGYERARFAGRADASAWFAAHRPALLAAQRLAAARGWDALVWQLAWAVAAYTRTSGHVLDELAVLQAGAAAVARLDDPSQTAVAQRYLARTLTALGLVEEASACLDRALACAVEAGDLAGQAYAHHLAAWFWQGQAEWERAVQCERAATGLFVRIGHPIWICDAFNALGWFLMHAGHPGEARTYCERALALAREHDYREGEANTLDSLGTLHLRSGDAAAAMGCFTAARERYEQLGNAYIGAVCVEHVGDCHRALGEAEAARTAWLSALDAYRAQSRPAEAATVEAKLAGL